MTTKHNPWALFQGAATACNSSTPQEVVKVFEKFYNDARGDNLTLRYVDRTQSD